MLEALESIFCFIRNFQIGNYYEEDSLQLQNMCIWDNNLLPVLTFSSSNLESMHSLMYDIINIYIADNYYIFPFEIINSQYHYFVCQLFY